MKTMALTNVVRLQLKIKNNTAKELLFNKT